MQIGTEACVPLLLLLLLPCPATPCTYAACSSSYTCSHQFQARLLHALHALCGSLTLSRLTVPVGWLRQPAQTKQQQQQQKQQQQQQQQEESTAAVSISILQLETDSTRQPQDSRVLQTSTCACQERSQHAATPQTNALNTPCKVNSIKVHAPAFFKEGCSQMEHQ
jgi:hypothetical protein